MTTFMANAKTVSPQWRLLDAKGETLGRLASKIAVFLRGKHKPEFTPHCDTGDFVIVINAKDVKVTGNKVQEKMYHRHSGYPGGIRSESFAQLRASDPERIIEVAVKGMLPKGPLGRKMFSKLKVYSGAEHLHAAQKPNEDK